MTKHPKYVSSYIDNRGTMRFRFRKKGLKGGHFLSSPDSAAFEVEYALFLNGDGKWKRKQANGGKRGPRPRYDYADKPSVYFVMSGRHIKIGWTAKPSRRLKELQIGSPDRLKVLAIVEGSQDDERRLHTQFRDLNIGGEWHLATAELKASIQRIQMQKCLTPIV